MSTCPQAADGKHTWKKLGSCFHTTPSARAGHDFDCYECERCGRVGHSQPRSFACGMRRHKPEEWEAILAAERQKCPIWERLHAQSTAGGSR